MSFDIKLQNNNSEANRLNKSITDITTVTGTLKSETSIIDPIIQIQCNLSAIAKCNYMTIPVFGRSYFITDITSISNDIVEISAHVDVLSTYANEIRGCNGITGKQEHKWNLYLNDGSLKIYQNSNVITSLFPSGFTSQEFVLAVAGS